MHKRLRSEAILMYFWPLNHFYGVSELMYFSLNNSNKISCKLKCFADIVKDADPIVVKK